MNINEEQAKLILHLAAFAQSEGVLTNPEWEFTQQVLNNFPDLESTYSFLRKRWGSGFEYQYLPKL